MAISITETNVRKVLGACYPAGPGEPSLSRYIATALKVVTKVSACEVAKGNSADDDRMSLMGEWMAAFYYTRSDPIYTSRGAGGASGSYVTDNLRPGSVERFRQGALDLDFYGCLSALLAGNRAGAFWNGRAPSEQTDYVDRD